MKKIQLAAFIAAAGLMLGSAYAAGLDAPVPLLSTMLPTIFKDRPRAVKRLRKKSLI